MMVMVRAGVRVVQGRALQLGGVHRVRRMPAVVGVHRDGGWLQALEQQKLTGGRLLLELLLLLLVQL